MFFPSPPWVVKEKENRMDTVEVSDHIFRKSKITQTILVTLMKIRGFSE